MKGLFAWLACQKESLPPCLLQELQCLHDHYLTLNERIAAQDKKLKALVDQDDMATLLKTIPGVGDLTASQCLADIACAGQFNNGRHMAAWLGLVPRQHSTGGKTTLLGISKRGNKHLRTLFIHGARAVLSRPNQIGQAFGAWLIRLKANKPFNVAVVALANKLARIAWSILYTKKPFDAAMLQA